ncbi:MAG: C-terminal binding protein [Lentisphaerae bacterium]|jgi:D-3-phosphoglycerate dehydrogenase|nr:C-terminal binding protein [Lentisphaerota bacterium]
MKTALISADEPGQVPQIHLDAIRSIGMELVCRNCTTREELIELAADADILWMFGVCKPLTAEVLDQLPKCRAIFRSGSGVDALPWQRATEKGIAICNSPESIAEAVAEHAAALLLALAKKIQLHSRAIPAGGWLAASEETTSRHLSGRTLGLVGYGRIARFVETMLSGFRLKIIHHDPLSPASVPLDELLQTADFISLHCPLTDDTRHMIGKKQFQQMKRDALLINTSRGAVVDESALVDALNQGIIAGAALDVTEKEPLEKDSLLRGMANVIITSHIAAFTDDFNKNFWECSVNKLKELMKGDFKNVSINLK